MAKLKFKRKIVGMRSKTRGNYRKRRAIVVGRARFYPKSHGRLSINSFAGKHPFPMNMWTNFTYTESLLLQSGASNTVGTVYNLGLNALWDVYLAAGGHQPYGFDQLVSSSGPYYRYKVWGVTIDLEFYDPSADTGLQVCCAVHNPVSYAAGATISGLTIDQVNEKHNTFTKYIPSTGGQVVRLRRYFPMNVLFNLTRQQFANDITTTTGSNAGNPSSTPALQLGLLDARATGGNVLVRGRLTFRTQLYDRAQLSQS